MTPQTYRKNPVEVETVRWDGSATEVVDWIINGGGTARYVGPGEGHHLRRTSEDLDQFIVIDTLEGPHRMDVHDIAIRDVAGEHYPCKPEIFAQTYSLVEDDSTMPEASDEPLTDPRPYSDPNSAEDIDNRFNYHPPTAAKVAAHESTRAAARGLAHLFDGTLPPGREKSLALTQLELALFWANAAIARHL